GDIRSAFPHVDSSLVNHDLAYPAMLRFLPAGLAGLVIAGLTAAYVSTIITHLNWGTSYLVHDCYRRFLRPGSSERHYVWVARVTMVGLMVLSAVLSFYLVSAKTAFDLLLSIGAGTGLLYLLRWFWWRINAWAEIAAMVGSFGLAIMFHIARLNGLEWSSATTLLLSIAVTTVIWVTVAYVTPPTPRDTLRRFYELVRPAGPGWRQVREESGLPPSHDNLPSGILAAFLGAIAVWSMLFAVGAGLYGQTLRAFVLSALALVTGFGCVRVFWRKA